MKIFDENRNEDAHMKDMTLYNSDSDGPTDTDTSDYDGPSIEDFEDLPHMSLDIREDESSIEDMITDLSKEWHSPTLYREAVIDQLMSVLISRDKPNAMIVGPAGGGKTKIVEELAHRIAEDDPTVPKMLKDHKICSISLGDIVSGCGLLGALESKVMAIKAYFEDPENKAILFLDEIHMLFSNEAYKKIAQILKPALSRGTIKVIAATTTQEVRIIDSDPAFNRRFTRILVDELTKAQTESILASSISSLEKFHKRRFSIDENDIRILVDTADEFCQAGLHRPDNALTLLDRSVANAILKCKRGTIRLTSKLIEDTAFRIASGNSEVKRFDEDELRKDLSVIKGQDDILEDIVKVIKLYDMHLRPRTKPLTFLFAGASGVGKSEVTKILAKSYLGEQPIVLNMTEYHSPASINRIIGSPSGYVGSDSNAELPFDALDTNPYQVILLDEFEKCDRSVQRLFMSVFDEGRLKTNRGTTIDFSKAIIVATTNAGCTDKKNGIGFGASEKDSELSVDDLSSYFDVELINRFSHRYTFKSITKAVYTKILKDTYKKEVSILKLDSLAAGIRKLIPAELDDRTLGHLVDMSYEKRLGARPALTTVTEYVDNLVLKLCESKTSDSRTRRAYVYCDKKGRITA